MTRFLPTIIVIRRIGIMVGLFVLPAAHADLPDIIDAIRPSIVGVGTAYPIRQPIGQTRPNQLHGTGFVVADGTIIATNLHVLPELLDNDNNQTLAVFIGRGSEATIRPAQVIAQDREHDLALLKIQGAPLPAMSIGDSDGAREGETIVFTGFPIGAVLGLYPVTHLGIISSITPVAQPSDKAGSLSPAQLRRMRSPFNVLQLDATAYPGNSGSPVYRESDGQVIGVLNSVFVKETRESAIESPSGISYAIPAIWLKALLDTISLAEN